MAVGCKEIKIRKFCRVVRQRRPAEQCAILGLQISTYPRKLCFTANRFISFPSLNSKHEALSPMFGSHYHRKQQDPKEKIRHMCRKQWLRLVLLVGLMLLTSVAPAMAESGYVGDETCLDCHEEIFESFARNRHGIKSDSRTPAAVYDSDVCESCHGPGAAHVEAEDGSEIVALGVNSEISADRKNDVCLNCHTRGKVALWDGNEHETRGLSCADCHSFHQTNPQGLSKTSETALCLKCHQQIRAQLMRQSHHPLREEKMRCSDCHNPHGALAENMIDAQDLNLKCFECHAEHRGPYLWEHPPVVEDCLACHTPHGSTRDGLLTAKMPYLCQRCHVNTLSNHVSQLYALDSSQQGQSVYRIGAPRLNKLYYRSCVNCHSQVHGSNHPSGKNLMR